MDTGRLPNLNFLESLARGIKLFQYLVPKYTQEAYFETTRFKECAEQDTYSASWLTLIRA